MSIEKRRTKKVEVREEPVPEWPTLDIKRTDENAAYDRIGEALEQRKPQWDPSDVRPDEYIHAEQECTPSEAAARIDFESMKRSLERLKIPLEGKRVLEIGSGMGYLLALMRKEGVNAIGIDMSPRDYRRNEYGSVIHAPLGALKPETVGQFGVILAKNVFDNDRYKFQVYRDMLADIDAILESGAVFVRMGTGRFKDDDIPSNWERVAGYAGDITEIFRKG